jgi:hypothetical protein
MLDSHRHVVEALRDALLERDELLAEEILAVIDEAMHPAEVVLPDANDLVPGA